MNDEKSALLEDIQMEALCGAGFHRIPQACRVKRQCSVRPIPRGPGTALYQ